MYFQIVMFERYSEKDDYKLSRLETFEKEDYEECYKAFTDYIDNNYNENIYYSLWYLDNNYDLIEQVF